MKALFILNEPTPYFSPDLDQLANSLSLDTIYCEDSPSAQGWGRVKLDHPHHVVGNGVAGAARVIWLLLRNDYDAIVSFSFRRLPRLATFLFARLTGTPLVVRTDTSILDVEQDSAIKRCGRRLVMQRFIPRNTRIWTIGANNSRFWSEEFDRHNQRLIPYEVRVLPAGDPGRDRHSEPDALRILYVGRLVEVKGVADLIDAVKLLDAKGLSTWTLRVVGDGPLADELRRRSSDETRIQLLGAIPHVDLAEVYRSADVLVLPSYREPWGLVVNEALGFGLRVIVSDRVGCAVDLVSDENGSTFVAGDIDALASALLDCLEHRDQVARRPHSDTAALMLQDLGGVCKLSWWPLTSQL